MTSETSDLSAPFVPPGFEPPTSLSHPNFVLEPIGPQHNESDLAAWTSSIPEIRAVPGFEDHEDVPWTAEENRADLERHAQDFAERRGFTYTVLDPVDRDVIGCVYIYPLVDGPWLRRARGLPEQPSGSRARVKAWVRADRQQLLDRLAEAVAAWLREWPFERVEYAGRPDLSR